jgi:hypothetical protein
MGGDSSRVAGETTSPSPVQQPDVSHGRQGSGIHLPICYTSPPSAHMTLLGQLLQKKRYSISTSLPGGTCINEGTTLTSPYGGACRHKEKARHEPALNGRTKGHGHGCYNKIGPGRLDHHMGHSGSIRKRQSGGDTVRATEKSSSDLRHSCGASLEIHRSGLPCFP